MDSDGDTLGLGACCICMGEKDVTTIVMLRVKNVVRGHGWGCVVCGLPADGASAVLCGECLDDYAAGRAQLRLACSGYPATDGRVPFDSLTEPHLHDMTVEH